MLVWNQHMSSESISSNSDTESRSKEKLISYLLFHLNTQLYSVIKICSFLLFHFSYFNTEILQSIFYFSENFLQCILSSCGGM